MSTAVTRSARRQWLDSQHVAEDRARVAALVQRAGLQRLAFSVHDLRDEVGEDATHRSRLLTLGEPANHDPASPSAFALHHERDLARHVEAMVPGLLTRVGQRFDRLQRWDAESRARQSREKDEEGGSHGAQGSAKSPHFYVLTSRIDEYWGTPPSLDPAERAWAALWVASTVAGGAAVPTAGVTAVMRHIGDLGSGSDRQTSLLLKPLAARRKPLARYHAPSGGERWGRWSPVGDPPTCPQLPDWIAAMAPLSERCTTTSVGHATLGEAIRELVEIAIARTRSPQWWPAGRSVQVTDLYAVAKENVRARELIEVITAGERPLGEVIGDACKARIAGAPRRKLRVVRVGRPVGAQAYYDVPDAEGFARRRLIVQYEQLKREVTASRLRAIATETTSAWELATHATDVSVRAMGSVRLAYANRELNALEELIQQLEDAGSLLGRKARSVVEEHRKAVSGARAANPERLAGAEDRARVACASLGLDADIVLLAARPLLDQDAFGGLTPARQRRGRSPGELLGNATVLRRHPLLRVSGDGAQHGDLSRTGRLRTLGVDRVDAILYLARQACARMLHFWEQGAKLLGATLRHSDLPATLLHSRSAQLRSQGLAAVALLGDQRAAKAAEEILASDGSTSVQVKEALTTLLLLGHLAPTSVPREVLQRGDPALAAFVRTILHALRSNDRIV